MAANGGKRVPMPGFVLLVRDRNDADVTMRIGFTVTKKIGGAVVRNRMKRRFRALAREIMPVKGFAGSDHVMIGRANGIERDFGCSEPSSTGRWMGFAHDRARTHPCRKGLAEGPVADSSAELPLSAELLGLCDHRH